jgi:hypothetical protein
LLSYLKKEKKSLRKGYRYGENENLHGGGLSVMKKKFVGKIPKILFLSLSGFLFLLWVTSFLDWNFNFEEMTSKLEFNRQKALASTNELQEAFDEILDDDTLIVVDASAAPGDSFWLTVNMVNNMKLGGWQMKLVYDASIIIPDTFVYSVSDTGTPPYPCTTWHCEYQLIGRAEDDPDSLRYYLAIAPLRHGHLDTLRFMCMVDVGAEIPRAPIDSGSGPVARFRFLVRDYAEPGTTPIKFDSLWAYNPYENYEANTFFDTMGIVLIPRVRDGIFTVIDTGLPPINHYPEFLEPVQSDFEVYEMTTLEFDVTARDVDGDSITLYMDPLDLIGLNYHFDTIEGDSLVTQRFDYTPNFDEAPATRYVKFIARDEHDYVANKTVTIHVMDTPQDLLIASSQQGGVPGSKERLTPFMITNSVDIYGFQFTFRWDTNRVDVDSIVRTDVIEGFSMYTNLGDSAGKATVLVFGLAGERIPAGVDTVVYPVFSVLPDAEPGEVDILLENAREAINPGYPSVPLGMVNGKFFIDMFGDANLDRMVDVGDVVSLVAYILGEISFTTRQELASDVNQDTLINVGDLVAMIDIILGRWMGPSPPMYPGPMAIVKLDYEDLQPGSSGEVKVMADLEVPVAGAQLQIDYDPDLVSFQAPRLSERSDHFIVEYRDDKNGKLILVLYNFSNDPIPAGEGNILSLPVMLTPDAGDEFKIELKEVVLADEKAALIPVGSESPSVPIAFELNQNYPNPFNPSTTIKFTLPSLYDEGSTLPTTLKIYNVLGKVVRTLIDEPMAPGVHHKIWDGRDEEGNQVASGIYFYRLRAGALQDTKKMVLMK